MSAPAYVPALVMSMSIAVVSLSLVGLRRALVGAAWPESARVWVLRAVAVLLIGWLAVALALALVGDYEGGRVRPAAVPYGALAPTVIHTPPISLSETAGRIIDAVPQHA
jgi:hypothetical protein